ncbi:nucleoside recognition domain-containing protein [Staphylococcus gallinarum]|uniref:Nucleoside recognition domain-containing protein n=1 Tax=Staphylococcus gallinarum TaxID=1293 RepID=A0A380FJS1_STAGA|nr:nucleoside recognition domain-containing protein [Staphylococcus gallinarum]
MKSKKTLPVAFLAGVLKDLIGGAMPTLIVVIITLSGILTVLCSTVFKNKLKPDSLMNNAFNVRWVWLVLRVIAVIFVWMTYLKVGSKVIYSSDTGGLVFDSLLPTFSNCLSICSFILTITDGIWIVRITGTFI